MVVRAGESAAVSSLELSLIGRLALLNERPWRRTTSNDRSLVNVFIAVVKAVASEEQAMALRGARYLHVLVPCPLGWGSASHDTIRLARLAREGTRNVADLRGKAATRTLHRPAADIHRYARAI